jgi:hypothetical protein
VEVAQYGSFAGTEKKDAPGSGVALQSEVKPVFETEKDFRRVYPEAEGLQITENARITGSGHA